MAEITTRSNPVYKTLNKPLTIMGVERTLFATALFTGGRLSGFASALFLGAIVIFAILLFFARIATRRDPKMLVFVIQAMSHSVSGRI